MTNNSEGKTIRKSQTGRLQSDFKSITGLLNRLQFDAISITLFVIIIIVTK